MKKTDFKKLEAFWGIPYQTLKSRKRTKPKEFKAFELGTLCLERDITIEDLEIYLSLLNQIEIQKGKKCQQK